MKSSSSNAVRKHEKKLRQYEEKNPDIKDDKYHELRRKVITIKVQIEKSTQRDQERRLKVEEHIQNVSMTDDDVLEKAFQENADINARNRKTEKNRQKRIKKKKEIQEKKQADMKTFYDEVIQPQLAKHIIMSIVQ